MQDGPPSRGAFIASTSAQASSWRGEFESTPMKNAYCSVRQSSPIGIGLTATSSSNRSPKPARISLSSQFAMTIMPIPPAGKS